MHNTEVCPECGMNHRSDVLRKERTQETIRQLRRALRIATGGDDTKYAQHLHEALETMTMNESTEQEAAPWQQVPHERVVIPPEVLDLVRFMCATWAEIDKFVYKHCDGDALMHYPVVQGTANQVNLIRIGEQPHNTANLTKAVKWMREQAV